MIKKILLVLPMAALLLSGCYKGQLEQCQLENDSLRDIAAGKSEADQAFHEISALMDSIEVSQDLLKVGLVEGTSYNDYSTRMANITAYIKSTEAKLANIESELEGSNKDKAALRSRAASYRAKLEKSQSEIEELKMRVDNYKVENDSLKADLQMYSNELDHLQSEIVAKQQELAYTEERVQELMIQAKVTEGDAYYARAAAVEEAANRTKLAPKKKKETLREALELYKKSLSFGKTEAQTKIDELEAKI